ncbi:MAG: hypothetical protein FJW35_02840 [Acidobacteria bacterium]|nr:hypothetical protein [Acidobacteriota bacterium]
MLAVFRFHAVVGARVALQSFTPLFAAIVAAVMLQMYPAALVKGVALGLFGDRPAAAILMFVAFLAFLLPAWAAPRLALGLQGWLRHLPVSDARSRRGLELSLLVVQAPLLLILVLLAAVARHQGAGIWGPVLLQLGTILAAGVLASLPVRRRGLLIPTAAAAALAALTSPHSVYLAIPSLILCEVAAGPIRVIRHRRHPRVFLSLAATIAWRALGWRLPAAYAAAMTPMLVSMLFVANNELEGRLAAAAFRFGFALSLGTCLALVSRGLAVRRPVWPWERSLPDSCARRVLRDALFLGLHAVPPALIGAAIHTGASLAAASLLPALLFRAAVAMRRIRESRAGTGPFFAEACIFSALLALLPWIAAPALASAPLFFRAAHRSERQQKVTKWLEAPHRAIGDSLSWSDE